MEFGKNDSRNDPISSKVPKSLVNKTASTENTCDEIHGMNYNGTLAPSEKLGKMQTKLSESRVKKFCQHFQNSMKMKIL